MKVAVCHQNVGITTVTSLASANESLVMSCAVNIYIITDPPLKVICKEEVDTALVYAHVTCGEGHTTVFLDSGVTLVSRSQTASLFWLCLRKRRSGS